MLKTHDDNLAASAATRINARQHYAVYGRYPDSDDIIYFLTDMFERFCGQTGFYENGAAYTLAEKYITEYTTRNSRDFVILVEFTDPRSEYWGLEMGYSTEYGCVYVQALTNQEWDEACT